MEKNSKNNSMSLEIKNFTDFVQKRIDTFLKDFAYAEERLKEDPDYWFDKMTENYFANKRIYQQLSCMLDYFNEFNSVGKKITLEFIKSSIEKERDTLTDKLLQSFDLHTSSSLMVNVKKLIDDRSNKYLIREYNDLINALKTLIKNKISLEG